MDAEPQRSEERVNTRSVMDRQADGSLQVPYKVLAGLENLAVGLRQNMIELTDDSGGVVGKVDSGAGLGNDFILIEWKDHGVYAVRGADLLRAVVEMVDPEQAKNLPNTTPKGEE